MIFATRPKLIRTFQHQGHISPRAPTTKAPYPHYRFPFSISSSALPSPSLSTPLTRSCREVDQWNQIGHRGSVFNSPVQGVFTLLTSPAEIDFCVFRHGKTHMTAIITSICRPESDLQALFFFLLLSDFPFPKDLSFLNRSKWNFSHILLTIGLFCIKLPWRIFALGPN